MSGKIQIGEFKGKKVFVDYDYFFKFKGSRLNILKFDKTLSDFLFIVGFLFLSVSLFLLFLEAQLDFSSIFNPKTFLQFSPYISAIFFSYALFLRRDRNIHDDIKSFFYKNWQASDKNFFFERACKIEVIGVIEQIYKTNSVNFLFDLFSYILNTDLGKYICEKRLGISCNELINEVKKVNYGNFEEVHQDLFLRILDEAYNLSFEKVDFSIVFFTLSKYYYKKQLFNLGIGQLELEGVKIWVSHENRKFRYKLLWERLSRFKPKSSMNRSYTARATKTLDEFGIDFTREVSENGFVTSVGKDNALKQVFYSLEKEGKSALMILGDPGVGKTHFLKYIASRMVVEDVPRSLKDKRMVVVDLNKLLTKSSTVEKFKSLLQKIFEEVNYSGNSILVLEDFTQILGIRDDERQEIVNTVVNAVDQLKLKLLATSNSQSYTKLVKPIPLLSSLFQTVELNPTNNNVSLQILIDEASNIEKKSKIQIHIGALKTIVDLSQKFDYERVMPDKGIDLLYELAAIASLEKEKSLTASFVEKHLSKKIGIDVGSISKNESKKLIALEEEIGKRVVGQTEAIKAVASAIRRSRAGFSSGKKPISSLLFFGPTGVGKTEVAKTLTEVYYGNAKLMIRVDMSEYQEESNLGRLIGQLDDKGNFIGGFLAEGVRKKPFSLVLLDELEKANKKVLDLFLQVLDEGFLTDGFGRKIDFSNTIIIATSNACSSLIADLIFKGLKYYDIYREVFPKLKEYFRIEFLNRFDKVIMFTTLSELEILRITSLLLEKIKLSLEEKGILLSWDEETEKELSRQGFSKVFGARELKRTIQEKIEDKLAESIVRGEIKSGAEVVLKGLEIDSINF